VTARARYGTRPRIYALQVVLVLVVEATIAWLLYRVTSTGGLELPLDVDTPWHVIRTVLSLGFFGFFVALMGRHGVLVVLSMLDQLDRATPSARPAHAGGRFEPIVSVIVPAFNEGPCIEAALRSLLALDYPRYEIIVVDDGSTDDTLHRARAFEGDHGRARVLVLWKPNGGKAAALNFGIGIAAGELVATMDGDSILETQTLRAAVEHFRDPDVGAVAGHVTVVNTINLWSRLQALEYITALNFARRGQGVLRAVSIVPGPIGVFRQSALASVGGYDTDTFAEDCDLTLKLLVEGWKIAYEPKAVARTEAPEEIVAVVKQRYRWTRGILQALRKQRRHLLSRRTGFTARLMLWYMVFESVVWPYLTVFSLAFTLTVGFDDALQPVAALFWLQLMLIDSIAVSYSLALEGMPQWLVVLTPVSRVLFNAGLDVAKVFATLEEIAGIHMGWGKLARKGRT
jgi:cellulose synthase/poly-beta-1,6-N-acetylglucosamine synthase-like glycosyltransferase